MQFSEVHVTSGVYLYKQREAKLQTLGLKVKRRNTGQFLSGFKMENHRIQSAKTLLMKDSSSFHGREDMGPVVRKRVKLTLG